MRNIYTWGKKLNRHHWHAKKKTVCAHVKRYNVHDRSCVVARDELQGVGASPSHLPASFFKRVSTNPAIHPSAPECFRAHHGRVAAATRVMAVGTGWFHVARESNRIKRQHMSKRRIRRRNRNEQHQKEEERKRETWACVLSVQSTSPEKITGETEGQKLVESWLRPGA